MLLSQVLDKIEQINAVLQLLSRDEDLQDDLHRLEAVQTAIAHWTGTHRLPPEQALELENHRRVVYVLQRFQMIQHVCRDAGIAVPIEYVLNGSKELSADFIRLHFKVDWSSRQFISSNQPVEGYDQKSKKGSIRSVGSQEQQTKVVGEREETTVQLVDDPPPSEAAIGNTPPSYTIDEVDDEETKTRTRAAPPSTVPAASSSSSSSSPSTPHIDVNQLLRLAISLIIVLIAVTLSYLPRRYWDKLFSALSIF